MLYNNLSEYLREKYGKRMKKICIDGGFSCPNRDGKCGTGGCIFCGERGSGEHITPALSIENQVSSVISQAAKDDLFIAYFQNFTNTYASPEILKERYDSALIDERIKILSIGTRPDCINEEIAKLISSYSEKYEVWVELGLQTANDTTAKLINRGYDRRAFEKAMEILCDYEIKTVVHLIIGLPGESSEDVIATAEYLSSFKLFGVKIHSLYVMEGTVLAKMYEEKSYTPPTLSEYADMASELIARISPKVILHRITGDCPKERLVAPEWNKDKNEIISRINYALTKKGYSQGCLAPRIIRISHDLEKLGYRFSRQISNVCFVFDTKALSLSEDTAFIALTQTDGEVFIEDMCETHDAVWTYVSDERFKSTAEKHGVLIKEGKYMRLYAPYESEKTLLDFIACLKELSLR